MRYVAGWFVAATVTLFLSMPGAAGAEWPSRPVRIVVPFAAGGAADTMGRVFAVPLSAAFGRQFFIDNRAGGGGIPGTEAVAKSDSDGYTLMVSGLSFHVIAPAMNQNAGFDPVRDFAHVAHFGGTPVVLVVHPSAGVTDFREFSALAGKDGVEYASAGFGSIAHLVGEFFAAKSGLKLRHVPYKGGGSAILDLVAGHVKTAFLTLSTTVGHIRSGGLVPIAVTSAGRLPDLPGVPTFEELGYKELELTSWLGLSGPGGLPKDVVDRLNREVNASMRLPEVRGNLEKQSILTSQMTPEEFTAFVQSEVDKWTPVVKRLGQVK
jgi:tripartite-type tricarboxylate transporter receptor subunit TctC